MDLTYLGYSPKLVFESLFSTKVNSKQLFIALSCQAGNFWMTYHFPETSVKLTSLASVNSGHFPLWTFPNNSITKNAVKMHILKKLLAMYMEPHYKDHSTLKIMSDHKINMKERFMEHSSISEIFIHIR